MMTNGTPSSRCPTFFSSPLLRRSRPSYRFLEILEKVPQRGTTFFRPFFGLPLGGDFLPFPFIFSRIFFPPTPQKTVQAGYFPRTLVNPLCNLAPPIFLLPEIFLFSRHPLLVEHPPQARPHNPFFWRILNGILFLSLPLQTLRILPFFSSKAFMSLSRKSGVSFTPLFLTTSYSFPSSSCVSFFFLTCFHPERR